MSIAGRVRIQNATVLSNDHYLLKKTSFDFQRADGTWQNQTRETYDRGDGATILLYNRPNCTVILTRQFRFPAFVGGYDDLMIEAPAGLLDMSSPEERIKMEAEEETGFRVNCVRKVFEAFMSPGAVTEKLHFFVAEYSPEDRISKGGGLAQEGEDIEVMETPIEEAVGMIAEGKIVDAKTIMLLQYAKLHIFQGKSGLD
jgi:nudix-type nucleoside diphosphatase (YffH/AdpP family)